MNNLKKVSEKLNYEQLLKSGIIILKIYKYIIKNSK
jgi:hypothetical protein